MTNQNSIDLYNIDRDILHKEIDLVQSCINRMASNSFLVKGWLITLLAVVIALLADKVSLNILCLLSLVAILCFWYLDAFFLRTEKLYRRKYEWVISERIKKNLDFLYDLNPYNKNMWLPNNNSEISLIRVIFSKTLIPFYGIPLIVTAGVFLQQFI